MIPPIANRFVAGETTPEALDHARELNGRGVGAILNLLGEHYHQPGPAIEDAEAYRRLVSDIDDAGLAACVSVKPSQLGLGAREGESSRRRPISGQLTSRGWSGEPPARTQDEPPGETLFETNLERIVDAAAPEVFVWLDMEDHPTIEPTISAFESMAARHPGNVGVCLQANMKRTPDDLARIADVPGKVRLVKGAYDPPAELAYGRRERVDEAYRDLLGAAFREFDGGIAVASHDPAMIEHALELHEEHGRAVEFQMLMGVRERAQVELAAEHEVWQYVPFGSKWLPYFYRRVTERKENLLFAARAVVGSLLGGR